jgi:c-di-GMP-binding flagellar brake protein YcgR
MGAAGPNQPADNVRRIPRRYPRVRLVTQVESRASGQSSIGRTENISEGGVLVLSRDTFEPETDVIVRFSLAPNQTVQARGTVVHATPGVSMGIQFVQIKPEEAAAIRDFVSRAADEQAEDKPGTPKS